jgi:hypothetical protein
MRIIAFAPPDALSFGGLTGYQTVRGPEKFHLRLSRNDSRLADVLAMTSGEIALIHDHMVGRRSVPPQIPGLVRGQRFHLRDWNPVRIPVT